MSRSQRHKIQVENYPSDCKVTAEGVISPGYLRQPGPVYSVPMGPSGGPLQGSSLAGPAPSSLPNPKFENPLAALLLLAAAGGGPINPPEEEPKLTSLSPNTAELGSADITMVCNGSGFTPTSTIHFADYDEPTTFISATAVSTGVKPSLGWGPVSVDVYVKSGPFQSETLQFTFTEPAPPPETIPEQTAKSTSRKGK
jgi:hypothetical protein